MTLLSLDFQKTTDDLILTDYNVDEAIAAYCHKDITKKTVLSKLKLALSNSKYQHSLSTARKASDLAKKHGANPQKALIAGLLHDYAKYMPPQELISYAQKNNVKISLEERKNPDKLHAPIGALRVREDFGVQDKEILSSIKTHSAGSENPMDAPLELLDKILIIADKIEPLRDSSEKRKKAILKDYEESGDITSATAALFAYRIKNSLRNNEEINPRYAENYNILMREIEIRKTLKECFF